MAIILCRISYAVQSSLCLSKSAYRYKLALLSVFAGWGVCPCSGAIAPWHPHCPQPHVEELSHAPFCCLTSRTNSSSSDQERELKSKLLKAELYPVVFAVQSSVVHNVLLCVWEPLLKGQLTVSFRASFLSFSSLGVASNQTDRSVFSKQ